MRIRRNARKILGTASSIPWQPQVVTEPAHASTAGYMCELNRSPWDVFVFPSPPPTPPPPSEEPQIEEGDEMRGEEAISMNTSTVMPEPQVAAREESSKEQEKNVNKRNPPAKIAKEAKGKKIIMKKDSEYIDSSTVALSTSFSSNIAPMQEEEVPLGRQEPNGMQEHGSKSKPAFKKFQKPTGKSTIMEKEIDYVESNGPFTCKKTDGKQWQCKRRADQPNSFCNYHIVQHRSYNKKAKAPTAVTLSVVDISRYPALVPWRGTRQVRGDIDCITSVAMEATTEQSKTEEILECDISNVTHQEDILETSEEEEKPKRKNANPVSRRRKRRRKLVKVRSLESLMLGAPTRFPSALG